MTRSSELCRRDRGYREVRLRMVQDQIAARGLTDPRVLEAMNVIPRHEFIESDMRTLAYEDRALPIACGQTISQPYVVALMCELAELKPEDHVLEVGVGSGYAAAVLAHLCERLMAIDRHADLVALAMANLHRIGVKNVEVRLQDGTLGWPDGAPYDAILVAAAAEEIPRALINQLAIGGRLIIPVGTTSYGQTMYKVTREQNGLREEQLGAFSFVPLVEGTEEQSNGTKSA